MSKEFPIQTQWHDKVSELGPKNSRSTSELEGPARKWLAEELRKLADHIEGGGWPQVFGCSIPEGGVKSKELMMDFTVVLSHPWPG